MKTVARYLDNNNNTFDGSCVSTLIKPKQVFVNVVVTYYPSEARADGLMPLGIGKCIDFIRDGVILGHRATVTGDSIGTRVNEVGLYRDYSKRHNASRPRSHHATTERLAHRGGTNELAPQVQCLFIMDLSFGIHHNVNEFSSIR